MRLLVSLTSGCDARIVARLAGLSREASRARRMVGSRGADMRVVPCEVGRNHADAIDRAGWHAQLATGAKIGDDIVHALARADDRIDRTCLYAERATDAQGLVDDGEREWLLDSVCRIQRHRNATHDVRDTRDAGFAARGTLVDLCIASRDRGRIRAAAVKAALPALGLRQNRVDAIDEGRVGLHGPERLTFLRHLSNAASSNE